VDDQLQAFYQKLLPAVQTEAFHEGEWQLCERNGWPDNQSCQNLAAWCWRKDEEHYLIVVNLSSQRSQALVRLPWSELAGHRWSLQDVLHDGSFERDGSEMLQPGLYVDLEGWASHFLKFSSG
jgi:hypothetical protein